MAQMTGGQAVVASLHAQGVDTVFGIISVHTLDLFDALFDRQDDVRFIGGRLELGCGYMADGYSRATGKPGVLLTSTGPGAADSVGAMGEAYFSASSLLQVTTNVESEFIGTGKMATHETKDQLGMFSAVTDWNAQIGQIESIPTTLWRHSSVSGNAVRAPSSWRCPPTCWASLPMWRCFNRGNRRCPRATQLRWNAPGTCSATPNAQ